MARLREINPKLDNELKKLNDKIVAAFKANGTASQTYKNAESMMQNIAKATNVPVKYKEIKGVKVPQVTRAATAYMGLPTFNQIALSNAVAGASTVKGIKDELQGKIDVAVKSGRIGKAPKSFKGMLKEVEHLDLIDKIRDQMEDSNFSTVQEFLNARGYDFDFMGALEGAFDDGIYDSAWFTDAESEVLNALESARGDEDALRAEMKQETNSEKLAQLQSELFKLKSLTDKAEAALNEIRSKNAERRARRR